MFLYVKEKVLLILPWIATSPANASIVGTHYSWVGWNNVKKFLAQGNNNNKQHHLGIEPGSSGSQGDPKPLHAAAPHI